MHSEFPRFRTGLCRACALLQFAMLLFLALRFAVLTVKLFDYRGRFLITTTHPIISH